MRPWGVARAGHTCQAGKGGGTVEIRPGGADALRALRMRGVEGDRAETSAH